MYDALEPGINDISLLLQKKSIRELQIAELVDVVEGRCHRPTAEEAAIQVDHGWNKI